MNQLLLVTVAIIEKDGQFLLVKRARDPYKDYWCFIGGCGEFKHTNDPAQAVALEVKADIHCEFRPTFFTYNAQNFEVPTVTLFFSGTIQGTPKINPKYVSEFKWCSAKEVLGLKLGFDHMLIFKKYLQQLAHIRAALY